MTTNPPPLGGHPNFSAQPPLPPQPVYPPQYQNTMPPAPKKQGKAVAALVIGIVAFITGWMPVVGIILGVIAISLAISALRRKQSKGLSITGLALGAIALILSIGMTISLTAHLVNAFENRSGSTSTVTESSESSGSTDTKTETSTETEPDPAPEEPVQVEQPVAPDLSSFVEIDDRSFALIAKDPDAHVGTNLILYGSIMQFDSATGRCAMLVSTAATLKEMSYEYEQNTMAVSGDRNQNCPVFDPLVEDDHVKLWATVVQSYSYETQIGGNTTVPMIEVWQAELLPATEY
ncbi:DUF4190 domain-containing protein [Microbacterium sp. A94]|uniref:DUF4190 domain-containing protein n=1 Tax=Microbacterium sp. A94 TaxID=3450717 RepID=UPI003F433A41